MILECHPCEGRTVHPSLMMEGFSGKSSEMYETPVHSFMIGRCYTLYWWLVTGAGFLPYDLYNVWRKVVWWRSFRVRSVFVTAYCPFLIILEIWDSVFCTSFTDFGDILQCDKGQTSHVTRGVPGWCFLCDELTDVSPKNTVLQAYSWLQQGRQNILNMCDLD